MKVWGAHARGSLDARAAPGCGARARRGRVGALGAHRQHSALRAAGPAPRLFHPDLRLGRAGSFPPRYAHDHARRFSARGCRRRRACRAVQPVAPHRIFALSLRGDPAGDADRGDCAAAPHLSAAAGRGARLRLDRRVLPGAREHHARPAFRRSEPRRPFPPLWRHAAPSAVGAQAAGGAALYPGRLEDRGRTVADRRRGRRDRGGLRRRRFGPRLSHRRVRLPAQHPAHVRGAAAPLGRRHRDLLRALARLPSAAATLARERHRARGLSGLQAAAPARLATGAVSHAGYGCDAPAQEGFMAWIASVIALVGFCAAPAQAQNYPAKPLHILVPYAPGGISDIASRILGAKLTEAWGQQVLVENRPGGNGFIAMAATAKAAPDGYTMVMATGGDVAINPAMFKEMPYDVEGDLAPIAMVSDAPLVLAAHAAAPYNTVAHVIAAATAPPWRISVATPDNSSINQHA